MGVTFSLSQSALAQAGSAMTAAANAMVLENTPRPYGILPSLSGIGEAVEVFLQGLSTGRAALADAAKTVCIEIDSLSEEASGLDLQLAGALARGYSINGGGS